MDTRDLIAELAATSCRCGVVKQRGHTFCRRCYYRLPAHMRGNLYRRINEGYAMAYVAAAEYLDKKARDGNENETKNA